MKFRHGDAVRLCTGGPPMSIETEVEDLLLCSWIEADGRIRRQTYSPRELEHCDRSELLVVRALKRLALRWTVRATF